MSKSKSFTSILRSGFNKYILKLGGYKVTAPYRINLPYQEDRRKYGKSDPSELRKNILEIAKEGNFNLLESNSGQIRAFLESNQLGIDCSGFVYHLLNYLLKQLKLPTMSEIGYPKASSTNVNTLLSPKFTVKVGSYRQLRPADLVGVTKGAPATENHIHIVMAKYHHFALLADSSPLNLPPGIGIRKISKGELLHYRSKYTLRRLKVLDQSNFSKTAS